MDNPYSAPSSNPRGSDSFGAGNDGVTPGVINQLARTKGWVRFLAVLGFIGSGLMVLAAAGMMLGSAAFGKAMKEKDMGADFSSGLFMGVGALYLVMGLIQMHPALKLNSFASAIGRLILSGSVSDLVDAIEQQRSFWKFVGVMLVIFLIFFVTMMIAAAVGVAAFQK